MFTDHFYTRSLVLCHSAFDALLQIGQFQKFSREHGLDQHIRVRVGEQSLVVRLQCFVTVFIQSFTGAQGLDAQAWVGILEQFLGSFDTQSPQSFQCPDGVKASGQAFVLQSHTGQLWHHRSVFFKHQELLGHIAPPAVGMLQVFDQLSRGFLKHAGFGFVALCPIVSNAPNTSQTNHFIQLVLFNFHP